jgi:thiol-disulfide isomerase/thioredoxin
MARRETVTTRASSAARPTLLGVAFMAIAVVASARVAAASNTSPLAVGAEAPPVSEPTARGTFDSATSRKPYVLELFAVWCPHCQREVAVLNQLERTDGNRVDVIAVPASPFGFDKTSILQAADVQAFSQRFGAVYRIGFDGLYSIAYDYGLASFPTIFVVDANRRVSAVETGEVPFEKLHADVMALGAP